MPAFTRNFGLRPVRQLTGAPFNGQVNIYATAAADSTAINVGDLVTATGEADADGTPIVTRASSNTAAHRGVVVGLVANPDNLNTPQFRAAGTTRRLLVADSRDTIFAIQANNAFAVANVGLNIGLAFSTPATTGGGGSTMLADTALAATTATHPLRVIGVSTEVDNAPGDARPVILVLINNHDLTGTTGA